MTLLVEDLAGRLHEDADRPTIILADRTVAAGDFWTGVRAQVAAFQSASLKPGERVAIWMPKGIGAIESLVAAMLCGAIAVPIDPRAPAGQAGRILAEIDPAIACVEEELWSTLDGAEKALPSLRVTRLGQELDAARAVPIGPAPDLPRLEAEDTALILMTSGSTGTPKGIELTHGNISAFSDWAIGQFGLTAEDRFLSLAPLHFDLSLLEILTGLRISASVRVVDQSEALFPAGICRIVETEAITVLYAVPTLLQRLLDHGGLRDRDTSALRWLLFAGEVFPAPALARLMEAMPAPRYANLFGPTETNVISCKMLDRPPVPGEAANIGSPCDHSIVRICEADGEPAAPGRIGEICVSGSTVMRGYWRRPDLTDACFAAGPQRMFRTGDYGYFDENGEIRFVGRRDRRVKLRGYRIELQEVESVAMESDQIELAAAAIHRTDPGDAALHLHVVPRDGMPFDEPALADHLARRLPRHALPDRIQVHEALPLTSTGKLDLRAIEAAPVEMAVRGGGA